MFGLGSLDELKYATFESTVPNIEAGESPTPKTLEKAFRQGAKFLKAVPSYGNSLAALVPSLFFTVRNQTVCFDDLERAGKGLSLKDVLGLASFLKEERNCKVVLLLNDEKFDDVDKVDFDAYLEKVVDITLVFAPTPAESANIALAGGEKCADVIRPLVTTLGISNVRVIRKALRSVQAVSEIVKGLDEEVLSAIARSIVLFVWCKFEPGIAPKLKYIKEYKSEDLFGPQQDQDEPNASDWTALLDVYGYRMTDEFDLKLISAVENGYFSQAEILDEAKKLDETIKAQRMEGSFSKAWALYHDNFEDNAEQVLDGLYQAFQDGCKYISPTNLNGTVNLFKELGDQVRAKQMVQTYVAARSDEPASFFDLRDHPFGADIQDEDVRAAFAAKLGEFAKNVDLKELLLDRSGEWSEDRVTVLAATDPEEYRALFKSTKGEEFRKVVAAATRYARIGNATPEMLRVTQKVRAALRLIGEESPINARRVSRYGVKVPDELAHVGDPPDE